MEVTIGSRFEQHVVSWTASATSSETTIMPGRSYALWIPAAFSAASLTFLDFLKFGIDNVTTGFESGVWVERYLEGSDLTTTVAAGKLNYLPAELFAGVNRVKFVLDTSETGYGVLRINT